MSLVHRLFVTAFLCASLVLIHQVSFADSIVIDFEDEDFDQWDFIDEDPENLGELGPSSWDIVESGLGFDDNVLFQGSNIWGDAEDRMLMGTIALFNAQEFQNFRLEVDVIAEDNDGMGFVWGYKDLDSHYRFQLMNDRWPEVPSLDGFNGPYLISHKRVSDESPWYELMDVLEFDEYIPYTQGFEEVNHWTLEVVDGAYTITTEDSFGDTNVLSGSDPDYSGGFVGIQLYAQAPVEFDNFTITPLDAPNVTGDFNNNGVLDAPDIDLLSAEVRVGTNDQTFDLNSDSLVNDADRDVWVTDLKKTWFGDANLDGLFDSTDFVLVFQRGHYEDDVPMNSNWEDGDWNGDHDFTSTDFVTAFQGGGYEKGPLPAINAVPEPSTGLLMLIGAAATCRCRRRAKDG